MTITHGKVHFLTRKNRGDYSHDEASVDLEFQVEDGQPVAPALDQAAVEAKLKVAELLGQTAPERKVAPPINEAHDPSKPVTRHRKVAKIAELGAPYLGDEAAKAPVTDAAAMTEDSEPKNAAPTTLAPSSPAPSATVGSDPTAMADEDFDAPTGQARIIPDKELSDACSAANVRTHNSKAIRDYIGELTLPPGGSKMIPQARRQEFLDGLAKIPVISE